MPLSSTNGPVKQSGKLAHRSFYFCIMAPWENQPASGGEVYIFLLLFHVMQSIHQKINQTITKAT